MRNLEWSRPLKFFVKGDETTMKKRLLLMTTLLALLGCTNKNIKIPENHMAPKEAEKGDSYIFIDSLQKMGISRVDDSQDGAHRYRVLFSTKANDIESLNIYYKDSELKKSSLESIGSFRGREYFIGDIEATGNNLEYFFEVRDGRVRYFLGESGGYSPNEITNFNYKMVDESVTLAPEWSKNKVWYGVYVDTFKNGDKDNDPIFNEMGPEYFFQPRARLSNGTYKSELIERALWRSEDAIGEFQLSEWNRNFNELQPYEKNMIAKYSESAGKNTRRYGGDLQGIVASLDYMDSLGVDIVNISSPFYSYSSHKKDAIDYRHVSPDYGTPLMDGKSEYKLLDLDYGTDKNNLGEGLDSSTWVMTASDNLMKDTLTEMHGKGMKVVVDINFEYVSKRFWALKRVAVEGRDSKYKNWFFIDENWDKDILYKGTSSVGVVKGKDGKNYRKSWIAIPQSASKAEKEELYRWNLSHLKVKSLDPDGHEVALNYNNKELRGYLIASMKKWMDIGVDGFRVDLLEGTNPLKEDIDLLLKENPELLIVKQWQKNYRKGIKWYQAKDNFVIGAILLDYLDSTKNVSKEDFENAIYIYSKINDLNQVYASPLYLDSKDTDRLFSMVSNEGRKYDTLNRPENGYLNIRPDILSGRYISKVNLASLVQLTLVGSPYIYYGSEVGMWGADAPYSRKPMIWTDKPYYERDDYDNYSRVNKLKLSGVDYNKVRGYIEYKAEKNKSIEDNYKKILSFREVNKELFTDGSLKFLEVIDEETGETLEGVMAYERVLGEKRAIIIINKEGKTKRVGIYTDGRGEFKRLGSEDSTDVVGKRLKVDIKGNTGDIYYN